MQWDLELVMLEGVLLIALFVSPRNSCMHHCDASGRVQKRVFYAIYM